MIRIHETFATKEQAEAFKIRYERSYHPMGYGTHIKIGPTHVSEQDEDGFVTLREVWLASGSRSASCD